MPNPIDELVRQSDALADMPPTEPPSKGNGEPPPPPVARATTPIEVEVRPIIRQTRRNTTSALSKEEKIPKPSATAKKILGDGERFKIYKHKSPPDRDPALVGDYSLATIQHAGGDLELFIQRHLVPSYGAGDYVVKAFNSIDQLTSQVDVSVLSPTGARTAEGTQADPSAPAVADAHRRLWDRYEKLESKLYDAINRPQRSFVDHVAELKQIKDLFEGDKESQRWAIQQYTQQHASGTPIDPMILKELGDLRTEVAALRMQPPAPMPMPPLPPPEPPIRFGDIAQLIEQTRTKTWGLPEIMSIIGAVAPLVERALKPPDRSMEFELMKQMNEHLREELREARSSSSSLKEMLEEVVAAKDLLDNFGGKDTGLAGAIKELVSSPAMAGLVQRVSGEEMMRQQQMAQMRQIEAARAAHARAQLSAQAPARDVPAPEQAEQEEAAKQATAPAAPMPPVKLDAEGFPGGFREAIESLEHAETNADRIQFTVRALQLLAAVPQYRPLVFEMLGKAKAGDREGLREQLGGFLNDCMDSDMLSEDAMERTLSAFDDHFDAVVEMVQKLM